MSKGRPWMLCPSGCKAHVVEGEGRDWGRYHCPRCCRCVSAETLAYAAYRKGFADALPPRPDDGDNGGCKGEDDERR